MSPESMFRKWPKNLTPRGIAALSVVAASFFLFLCVARYGRADFETLLAGHGVGFSARVAGPLVQTIGAGAYVLTLLPLAWGVIVFFDEETPDVVLRGAGTVVLAASTALLVGLFEGGQNALWAG